MSSKVVLAGSVASREPPNDPVCDTTSPACSKSSNMRRMTTGLVFTLSATWSDFKGSSPDQAIKLSTCTATAKRLLVGISKHGSQLGKQFCNHYSYNLDFVNYLIGLDFFAGGGEVEFVEEVKQDVQVDRFWNEGQVAY